jgi:hypothetical protein
VNTLRATFLFIMAAEKKDEDGSNSIQKFKQYLLPPDQNRLKISFR